MRSAHSRFAANLVRARDLQALFVKLKANTTGVLDLSDILRASIVSAVSALDNFVHEITRLGMLEIFKNTRAKTDAFHRFSMSMENVLLVVANPSDSRWLENEIRKQHSWLSFQQPDKIADAIRLISNKKLWEEVAEHIGIDTKSAKTRLELIVDRRNKIAHEADMDPTSPGARWPIDEVLVKDAIDTLEQIGNSIFDTIMSN